MLRFLTFCLAIVVAAPILACAGAAASLGQSADLRGRTSCSGLSNTDTTVYDTTQVTERPYARSGPRPEYPDELRRRYIEGHVVLSVVIAIDGTVDPSSITIIKRDRPAFEDQALRWARGASYWPGCRAGVPVRVRFALPMDFTIRR
jgi:TonB family protein